MGAGGVRARIWFVDVVRLIASLQMINGHTLEVLLIDAARDGVIYERYQWVRGLVSVAFLTVAGIAFHLATLARFEAHRSSREEVTRRFRRAGVLLLLGYFLRFPGAAFGDDPVAAARAWQAFFQVDVLQTIGVTLFLLEVATVLARRPGQVVAFAGAVGALLVGAAPWLQGVGLEGARYPFASYLTHAGGSQFPLLPWAGFMLLGVVVGAVAMPDGARTASRVAVPRLAAVALALALGYLGLDALGPLGPAGAHPATAPAFSLLRLATVVGVVTALGVLCAPLRGLPRLLRILSAETLFVYVFHLWVLYAGVTGIQVRWGRSLSLGPSLAASASMIALTVTATLLWHHRARLLQAARAHLLGPSEARTGS